MSEKIFISDKQNDYINYKKIFKNREFRLRVISLLSFIPNKPYLKLVYKIKTGKNLNLKNPVTFGDKQNWLKIHDVHPEYSKYADKYYMKKYITKKFGSKYVIPCLGVWDKFEDIDFTKLPQKFVLKCSHDGASSKVIDNISQDDKEALKKFFNGRFKVNNYALGREYAYKNIKPRIIAEKYIETKEGAPITDCKIMCFNGKVEAYYLIAGKGTDERITWFNKSGEVLDIIDVTGNRMDYKAKPPTNINQMISMSEKLSTGMKFVRVDFFVDGKNFYFAEMTFFNNGGFVLLKPEKWEHYFGDKIDLTLVKQ